MLDVSKTVFGALADSLFHYEHVSSAGVAPNEDLAEAVVEEFEFAGVFVFDEGALLETVL